MSSFIFKIIGIISMLCDHIGIVIHNNISYLRCIGRLTLPIFAWQLSIGVDKTKNIKKYAIRLLIFAIISQPFYMLFKNDLLNSDIIQLNIGFTLILGLICIIIIKKDIKLGIPIAILLAFIAERINIEYGWYGITMIVIFHIFKDNKSLLFIGQILNFLAYYYINPIWQQGISLISILVILFLYNNKKGKDIKWLFYIFYPLHFLILYIIF